VGIASVVDLNIGRWWGKSTSARSVLDTHVGRRWWWEFDSNILITDVWVKGLILFKSLVSCSSNL
jgi:hypothetical protein